MMTKEQEKQFIDDCIDRGKFVDYEDVIDLSYSKIIEIEDVLHRFNDSSARSKIRKIIRNLI